MKRLVYFYLILILSGMAILSMGCAGGITTPDTGGGTPTASSASITSFKVSEFSPGEKVKLTWEIEGTYDKVKLLRRDTDGTYQTVLDTSNNPGSYEDTSLEGKKVYIYKLEIYSSDSIQDTKRYILFSSTDSQNGVRVIYNIDLNGPSDHTYEVDMWIDTGSYSDIGLKTIANHFSDTRTLRILSWISTSYCNGTVSGDPDEENGVILSGKGIYFIHYKAELPPEDISDHGIQGLFNNKFFLAAGSQHLLLVKQEESEKLSYVYKTFNTPTNWDVFSPEEPLEDKTYMMDFSDIDGCYTAYHEISVISIPEGTYYEESKNIYGTDMEIVLDKKIPDYKTYIPYMFKIFENECWIFGEGVGKRYGVYVVHYDKEVYTSENTYSQGYSDRFEVVSEMYTHQIFHRWNGWEPYGTIIRPEDGYFRAFYSEAWNNYFNDWNRTKVLPGYNWDDMKHYYRVYKTEYLNTPKDIPVAFYGNGDPYIWYQKGPLVVYLLNKEIERVTNGGKSMVDVQREIWDRYGYQNGTFDYEDIIQIINKITGADFHQFFNDYVFGKKEIKIPEFE